MPDVLIIGAGLSGLVAADALARTGATVLVLDKGRGVGGRLATRRFTTGVGTARFDHGAQFFTVRSDTFADMVSRWPVEVWHHGPARATSALEPTERLEPGGDGHPRYVGTGGMTGIAKHLAGLHPEVVEVRTSVRVETVEKDGDGWRATWDGGSARASRLLVTAPVPQTAALLPVPLPADVARLGYDPCVALLVALDGPSGLPGGAIEFDGGPIHYLADNAHKGISEVPAVTIHAGAELSSDCFDDPDDAVSERLWAASARWLHARPLEVQVKRWRYAAPTRVHPERAVSVADGLVVAGDIFGQAAVEGAALSGLAAAEILAA